MTTRTARTTAVRAVTAGMLLLTAALVWWAIYYAKAATATRAHDGGLASLTVCLAATTERCASVETGTEYVAPAAFFEDEDETWRDYAETLVVPNAIARYQPALFWIAAALLLVGLGLAAIRKDVGLQAFANHDHFVGFAFILPSLVGFGVFFLYPAIGARLHVIADDVRYVREMRTAVGYLSGAPARLHLGLPEGATIQDAWVV